MSNLQIICLAVAIFAIAGIILIKFYNKREEGRFDFFSMLDDINVFYELEEELFNVEQDLEYFILKHEQLWDYTPEKLVNKCICNSKYEYSHRPIWKINFDEIIGNYDLAKALNQEILSKILFYKRLKELINSYIEDEKGEVNE